MPEAKMSFNKRTYPRVPAHIPVTYLVMKGQQKDRTIQDLLANTKKAETVDASLGGMLLGGKLDMDKGDLLTLKITIPGRAAALSAFAKVMWVKEEGVGVNFVSMTKEDNKALDVYLKSFPPEG